MRLPTSTALRVGGAALAAGGAAAAYRWLRRRGSDAPAGVDAESGAQVRAAVTIRRPREEVYAFWRDLQNLPRFLRHLESVTPLDERRSRWVARPIADRPRVTWEAEIVEEEPGRLLAWRSLPGSEVAAAGSVRFDDAAGSAGGTEVRVVLRAGLPSGRAAGPAGEAVAWWTEERIERDLARLKSLLEAGEIPTTEGQPAGGKRGR